MKKRKNHRFQLSKKDRTYYKLFFAIVFSSILVLSLSYDSVVLWLNSFKNYYYVSPTFSSITLYFVSLFFCFVDMLSLYRKTYLSKIPLNKLKENVYSIKSTIIFTMIVFVFFIVSLIVSVTNVSYINTKGEYRSIEISYNTQDIDSIEVSVEESLVSFPKMATYREYELICKVGISDKVYYLNSSYFYNYSDLYSYLILIDKRKITVIDSKFEDLIEYEKKHLNNQNEINSLSFIRKLSN